MGRGGIGGLEKEQEWEEEGLGGLEEELKLE